jgi:glycosyltransferase involved in cell wall biosynthesis
MISGTLIALPAKDEETRIRETIVSVSHCGGVYVFDHNSTDKTSVISEALGVKVINSPVNGYEPVVYHIANYFLKSNYEVLVILDADGEVGLRELPSGLSMLQNHYGAIGNRDLKNVFWQGWFANYFLERPRSLMSFAGLKYLLDKRLLQN